MALWIRYNMIYRSAGGVAVYVTSLRREGIAQIRAAQEALGSRDFQTAEDRLPWIGRSRDVALRLYFRDPTRPTWDECLAFIKANP